jgi:hypothetical protein
MMSRIDKTTVYGTFFNYQRIQRIASHRHGYHAHRLIGGPNAEERGMIDTGAACSIGCMLAPRVDSNGGMRLLSEVEIL